MRLHNPIVRAPTEAGFKHFHRRFLASADASNDATIEFTTGFNDARFRYFRIFFVDVFPADNDVHLRLRFSSDGGSSFDSGSNYAYAANRWDALPNHVAERATAHTFYPATSDSSLLEVSNISARGGASAILDIYRPFDPNITNVQIVQDGSAWIGAFSATRATGKMGTGAYHGANFANAIQFSFQSGNITSGHFRLYGIKEA